MVAQHRIAGRVTTALDSSQVTNCFVYLDPGRAQTLSDAAGYFEFDNIPNGTYTLTTKSIGSESMTKEITVSDADVFVSLRLQFSEQEVDEFTITGRAQNNTYMKSVENMGIYEGKKTEVIVIDSLVANVSTNNARQIFSRVPGLNIWENDGAGIQLGIGGRGLDPNRTSNFNVRQNGYDISADALGYPESYYTPPAEAIDRIQIVRGAASLQYGTQFGGLLNFMLKKPTADKKIQLTARQTLGSFGFYNAFTSLSGTVNKWSYYTFFQYKKGNGWRPNSGFEVFNYYGNVNYKISKKTSVGIDLTLMNYLAQQPGGLSDQLYDEDPRKSNRARNWFKVKWNMLALHFNHQFNPTNEVNVRLFGLSALRYSIGFRPFRVGVDDDGSERDLIKGVFNNWGVEARYLKHYNIRDKKLVLLLGTRYYHGFNHSVQGFGSKASTADFNFVRENETTYDYTFLNQNVALFVENIIHLSRRISLTPGLRYEYIHTTADGYYGKINRDLAGNITDITRNNEERVNERQFLLGGIGLSVKPLLRMNITQNYRSITFSDMRIANPSSVIDQNLQDEKGYSADLGIRSERTNNLIYDCSIFYINYNNRIGEAATSDANNNVLRKRGNIGQAILYGIESYIECDVLALFKPEVKKWGIGLFSNVAYIKSEYLKSENPLARGKQVEYVPAINAKLGTRLKYKQFKASFQYGYVSDQYADATNEKEGGVSAVAGLILAYQIMDLSFSYEFKIMRLEASINNLADKPYYTRRATGYPGPGILPSDGRGFYLTAQIKL
jgi:Fe(3+) dicitrate transport protein